MQTHPRKLSLVAAALTVAALAMPVAHAQNAQGGMTGGTSGAATSGMSGGAGGRGSDIARADRKMLRDIAQANMAEIATGQLALEKSQSAEVKTFAQKMIDDHTKGLDDTKALASAKGVDLPDGPDVKHKALATAMKAMSGETFDRQYMAQAGLRDHRATHELLQKTERTAKDPELKALAAKMLPVVHGHLEMAQGMPQTKTSSKSNK